MPIDVMEIDSGSYEVAVNGTTEGYAWFTVDAFNNKTAFFVTNDGISFPFVLQTGDDLTFTRINVGFKEPAEFGKWGKAQLGGGPVGTYCMIETQIAWDGT